MNWFRNIGPTEFVLIGLFALFYLIFAIRSWIMARRLHSTTHLFWVKMGLRTLFFSLVVVSILGPSFGGVKKEVKAVGKDLILCLDLSRSMNCTDVQPSRLEKAKFELKKLMEAMAGDRIALIVFSGDAHLYCPFTFDKSALNTLLETASTKSLSSEGTDFGKALELAEKKFKEISVHDKKVNSKVVILVSDGEDFGGESAGKAASLEREGIRVFSLGVGTREGAPVPDDHGGWELDENDQQAISKLNPTDLQTIAENARGRYFELTNSRNEVPSLIEALSAIEGEVWDVKTVDIGANKYMYFLLLALAILLLDILFTINIIRV